jgi:hypothetical protein
MTLADMLGVITKEQYWSALEDPIVQDHLARTQRQMICLKHIQDAWILSLLCRMRGKKILEAGGGFARVLRTLVGNERWNLDKPSGPGRTVKSSSLRMPKGIKGVSGFLGEFSEDVPSNYFDVVFSISVIEHISPDNIESFFMDQARILGSGGIAYHAIDMYLGNNRLSNVENRIDAYLDAVRKCGLHLIDDSTIYRPLTFQTSYASNPDLTMQHWNKIVPRLSKQRAALQSVSLTIGLQKDRAANVQ